MSEITVKDFEGLNLKQFAEKLQEVDSIELLSAIEEAEKAGEARKGAISAINERQGELVDQAEIDLEESIMDLANDVEENLDASVGKPDTIEDDGALKEGPSEEPPIEGWDDKSTEGIVDSTDKEIDEAAAELAKALGQDLQQTEPVKKTDLGGGHSFTEGSNQKILAPEETKGEAPGQTTEEAIALVKDVRLEIDKVLQFAEAHFGVSPECEKPLFLAKAWLGKLLADLGTISPYAVKIKTTKDIPATAQQNEGIEFQVAKRHFSNLNTLQAVIELRDTLEDIIWAIKGISAAVTREGAIARTNAYTNACEAKFFLGTDLARLRN